MLGGGDSGEHVWILGPLECRPIPYNSRSISILYTGYIAREACTASSCIR